MIWQTDSAKRENVRNAAVKRDIEDQLFEDMASFTHDSYGWVLYAFDWGHGELKDFAGPEPWQKEILLAMDAGLITITQAIQIAVASGHGIGKSALVAWIILWGMSTFEDTRGIVTANTDTQLRTKTWPELAKWHRRCIVGHWFTLTATAIFSKDPKHEKNWRMDIIPWDETNTEAFAGLHNIGKRIILIFDEGSGIHDKIWEVSEGALTDENTEIIWCAFGNPTRNTGRFHDCFGRLMHRWIHRKVDSRSVSITNKAQLNQWVEDYGEDSDFVRVRIKGEFPKQESDTLIPFDWIEQAHQRKIEPLVTDICRLGVDVARFGNDKTVIYPCKGRTIRPARVIIKQDTMVVTGHVINAMREEHAAVSNVDVIGIGSGVVDRLDEQGINVVGINVGESSEVMDENDHPRFANLRSEIWWNARECLDPKNPEVVAIEEKDDELDAELSAAKWTVDSKGRIKIEEKDKMKERLGRSPDKADAFCLAVYKSKSDIRPISALSAGNLLTVASRPDYS